MSETEPTSNLRAQDNAEVKRKKRGSVGTKRGTSGTGRKQGGKRTEKGLLVIGASLLMGQHELNTTAAIVYRKHYSNHESGEDGEKELDMEDGT